MNETKKVKSLDWLDNVLIMVLLAYTAFSTWHLAGLTTTSTGVALILRSLTLVGITEGSLLFWHNRRSKYSDQKQQNTASAAMWISLTIVTALTLSYTAMEVAAQAGISPQDYKILLDGGNEVSIIQAIGYLLTACAVFQVAGNLAAIFYIESLSPAAKFDAEQKQAEQVINTRQLEAFRAAQKAIADTVGTAQALAVLRGKLTEMGYTEREIANLLVVAENRIQMERALPAPDMAVGYQKTVDTVNAVNPTPPSTRN